MAHRHLLLCLGTGTVRNPEAPLPERQYNTTPYFRPDRPDTDVSTPFVGEAILHLYPQAFSHVHLFGTADSMWDTLYSHLLSCAIDAGQEVSEAELEHDTALRHAVNMGALAADESPLRALEERFARRFGVRCTCSVVPLPENEAAFRRTLERVARVVDAGRVSIDITHGLRVQPFFLLASLLYLRAARPDITLGTAFYGARDMRSRHNGRAPLLEQHSLLSLLDWIDAARAFDRYGDAIPVATLLADDHRARSLREFSEAVQLNALRDLKDDGRKIVGAFAAESDADPLPLKLLLPRLLEVPRTLVQTTEAWQAKMVLAERHLRGHNLGLALLAAREALVDRIGQAYQVDPAERRRFGVAQALTYVGTGGPKVVRDYLNRTLPTLSTHTRFPKWARQSAAASRAVEVPYTRVAATLKEIRDGMAHADEGLNGMTFEPRDVARLLLDDDAIGYLHRCFESDAFDRLSTVYPDWQRHVRVRS